MIIPLFLKKSNQNLNVIKCPVGKFCLSWMCHSVQQQLMGCDLRIKDIYSLSNGNSFSLLILMFWSDNNEVIVIQFMSVFKNGWILLWFALFVMMEFKSLRERKLGASKINHNCNSRSVSHLDKNIKSSEHCSYLNFLYLALT